MKRALMDRGPSVRLTDRVAPLITTKTYLYRGGGGGGERAASGGCTEGDDRATLKKDEHPRLEPHSRSVVS